MVNLVHFKLTSDLHLLAHVMSEEHLAIARRKDNGTLHSSAICYDFLVQK